MWLGSGSACEHEPRAAAGRRGRRWRAWYSRSPRSPLFCVVDVEAGPTARSRARTPSRAAPARRRPRPASGCRGTAARAACRRARRGSARLLDDEQPPRVAGRRGDVDRAVEVADLDEVHAAAGRRAAPAGLELPVSSFVLAVALVLVAASRRSIRPQAETSAAAARRARRRGGASRRMPWPVRRSPGIDCRHEPAKFDVVVIGAGPAGEVVRRAPRRRRSGGRARRAAPRRRRVLLLRAACRPRRCCAPARRSTRPGASRAPPRPSTAARRAGRARPPRRGHPRPRRRAQLPWLEDRGVALVRGHGRMAGERTVQSATTSWPRAARSSSPPGSEPLSRRSPACATRARGPTARPRPPRRCPAAAHPRRRRRRRRDGAGVRLARLAASTVVEAGPRMLAREEPFAAEQVCAALRERGVDDARRHPGDGRAPRTAT